MPWITVESTECSDHSHHDSHRMSIVFEPLVELDKLLVDQSVPPQLILK